MSLRLITAPTTEPVSVATARSFLRVDTTADDTLITSLVKAAREKGEELSRRALITQTWEMTLDCWPRDCLLRVLRPPLQSVSSVKYLDQDAVEHTVDAGDYVVDIRNVPGAVYFKNLPSEPLLESGAITVRFVAGYGSAETNVPERLKQAILSLVAYWYENRESQLVPPEIKRAFVDERVVWF